MAYTKVFLQTAVIPELSFEPGMVVLNDPKIIDFLPDIRPSSPLDIQVLQSWSKWFRAHDVPFAVVRDRPGRYVMWKIDERTEEE